MISDSEPAPLVKPVEICLDSLPTTVGKAGTIMMTSPNFFKTSNVKKTPIRKKTKTPKLASAKKVPAGMIAAVLASEHNRFVCNDLEQYLDHIKKADGNMFMETRNGTELRVVYLATVNMFTTPDAKLGGVIHTSDPTLTQHGSNDNLVVLVPTTKDGVVKAAEQ
jgi:hypothetical protein